MTFNMIHTFHKANDKLDLKWKKPSHEYGEVLLELVYLIFMTGVSAW